MPVTTAATFCATLTDEWVRSGVRHAIVAPGSRSTPIALALAAQEGLSVHVVHDERSASFTALGIGLATGRPAVLLCTSGTAAAHFHAAVVEAHQAEVPLLVCTADRPPELRDVSAPQTIDQTGLYGGAVRWFHDPGVPDESGTRWWRSLGSRSVADAAGPVPGPVHLNLPFRDPLVGEPGPLPEGRAGGAPWHRVVTGRWGMAPGDADRLAEVLDHPRGVIVAGHGAGDPEAVLALAAATGWPVLAEPRSGCRVRESGGAVVVAAADALLRHPGFARDHTPAVVLRLGRPLASKVLAQWLAASGARHVQIAASPAWIDPDRDVAWRVVADPSVVCRELAERMTGATGTPWAARWRAAEGRAHAALADALDRAGPLNEPAIARAVMADIPDGGHLVVASSMPVRDLEWYAAPRSGVTVHANRGANGIDGVTSTAVGVALGSGAPTVLLIGDVAFHHDATALLTLARRDLDVRAVVVDNDGGGIFSFLPQATALTSDRFEQLFGTPHATDPGALAAAHGLAVDRAGTLADLRAALAEPGPRVVCVRTDRAENVAVHAALHAAVAAALG
jgi:2-succinyl-5-enolpyruvyl-6-hydroxy-3-cyclohexene-1-carboxylate synthase